ncbi:MAG: hypothetical protein ACLR8P_06695 [Clostridium fessum]
MELVIQNKQREKEEKAGRQKTFFDKKEELNERLQLLDRENFRLQNQRERLNERIGRRSIICGVSMSLRIRARKSCGRKS